MEKISIKNLFEKSEADTGKKKKSKMLILLLILIVALGVFYLWGYPLLFPESPVNSPVASVTIPVSTVAVPKVEVQTVVKEKTAFEIEMEKRKQGYEEKIFVYEPYVPPGNRNPFQKVTASYFFEETAGTEEEGKEGSVIKFQKPELPQGTKLTGIIGSKDNSVAIIEMNGEIFIANLYDILLDRYIVKEIKKDEVVLELNDCEFSLKIGGEDTSDGL